LKAMESSLAQTQMAFMRSMETTFLGYCGAAGTSAGQMPGAAPMLPQPPAQWAAAASTAPAYAPLASAAPATPLQVPPLPDVRAAAVQPPVARALPPQLAPPQAVVSPPAAVPSVPVPAAPALPVSAAPVVASGFDMGALMLEIVSEKTGYPVEMLTMDMALEADLGVDSIKRVEILSAIQDRVPGLPEIDPAAMASLRTLGQIADYLKPGLAAATPNAAISAPAPVPAKAVAAPAAPPQTAPGGLDLAALEQLMLEVVAEKTGYPVEMLTMEMALEADLGVDSIKRVEILSAVQDRVPGLPEIDAGAMASLRTLGQIVEFMARDLGPGAAAPTFQNAGPVVAAPASQPAGPVVTAPNAKPQTSEAPRAAQAAVPSVVAANATVNGSAGGASVEDLTSLMLTVVAEKTGYPVEMLNLDMALEADLGVDSIKRVEILSAVQERAPGLPEIDAAAMASLRTLGQIVEFMSQGATPALTAKPTEAALGPRPNLTVAEASATVKSAIATPQPTNDTAAAPTISLTPESASPAPVDLPPTVTETPAPNEGSAVKVPEAAPVAAISAKAAPQRLVPVVADAHSFAAPGGPRQELRIVEAPAKGLSLLDRQATGPVLVATDGTGIAEILVSKLVAEGFDARLATDVSGEPAALIDLAGLGAIQTPDAGIAINRAVFERARVVAVHFAQAGGTYVTVQDTGGDFGLTHRPGVRAWSAGLSGLAKTAAQEWPGARVRALDVETAQRSPVEMADAILAELLWGGHEREVGLSASGQRMTIGLVDAPALAGLPLLSSNDVVLAAGGARGVTAATLIALSKVSQPRVVLLGRTPLEDEPVSCQGITEGAALKRALLETAKAEGRSLTPAELGKKVSNLLACREVRDTLRQLRKAGSEALYLEADVRDAKSLEAALSPIRGAWGPITALVHGAGVLADKRLQDKTLEQFDSVFDTKVGGLRALLTATTGDPLKAIVLFSSVAGRHGNSGQADYAMANEVLNKVAQAESGWRGDDCVVKSLNWGPWAGGMVTPELAAHFEKQGVPLLPVDVGAAMMVAELRDVSHGAVEVVLSGSSSGDGGSNGAAVPALAQPKGNVALEVAVAEATHGFLNGHCIQETPVVPAVMVLEWFLAAAHQARPDLAVQAVKDLRVLKGIQLAHFTGVGDRFTVRTNESTEGALTVLGMELRAEDGTLHYAAAIELVPQGLLAIVPPPPPVMGLDAAPWDVTELYGDLLFHGGPFQVIRALEGVSREGMVGDLAGLGEMGWGGGPWQTDVAMLDGGLQLARLWGIHMLGRPSLPTALGEFRMYQPGPAHGPIRCEVRARVAAKHRTVTDIRFLDEFGELVAELRGVEMHLLPEQRPAQMVELG
jgi:acyl carrier protein/NADP-dependent 3-hydroxy acid dehydrogenase YdfG